jgi:hypothetical protein
MSIKKYTEMRHGNLWHIIDFQMLYEEREQSIRLLINKKLYWFPKSQIILFKISKTIEVPDWLYIKKFLEGE